MFQQISRSTSSTWAGNWERSDPERPQPESGSDARFLVILAEDDDEFRSFVACGLRKAGHEVVEVSDGVGLVSALVQSVAAEEEEMDALVSELSLRNFVRLSSLPTLVVSDIRMPGTDALSVLQRFHDSPYCPPFVLMTAFGDKLLHQRARILGARAVLDKPFKLGDLMAAVRGQAGVEPKNDRGPPTKPDLAP